MYDGNLRKWERNQTLVTIANTGGTVVTRFGPWDFSNLHRKTLTLVSTAPSATFIMGNIEISPDGVLWGTLDATTIPTFGAGRSHVLFLDSIKWWRINTCVAAGSIATFSYWWTF